MQDAFESWFRNSGLAGYMKKEDARKVWHGAIATVSGEALDLLEEFAEHGLTSSRVHRARAIVKAVRQHDG